MIWTNFSLTSFIIINSILLGWQETSAVPFESRYLTKRGWFGSSKKPRLTRVTTHDQKIQDAGWVFATPDGKAPRTPVPRVRDHAKGFIKDAVETVKYKVKSTLHPERPTGKPLFQPGPKISVDLHKGPRMNYSPSERTKLEDAGYLIKDLSSKLP